MQVFDVMHKSSKKTYALKMIPIPADWMFHQNNAQGLRREDLEHEADFLRELKHENIIEFHETFNAVYRGEDYTCIVTEMADGKTILLC